MTLFRDVDGNFYEVPQEELQRFKVEGDLPEGAELGGSEPEFGARGDAQIHYFWDSPTGRIPDPARAGYYWDVGTPKAPDSASASRYFWDTPKAIPVAPAHLYDTPRAAAAGLINEGGYVYVAGEEQSPPEPGSTAG